MPASGNLQRCLARASGDWTNLPFREVSSSSWGVDVPADEKRDLDGKQEVKGQGWVEPVGSEIIAIPTGRSVLGPAATRRGLVFAHRGHCLVDGHGLGPHDDGFRRRPRILCQGKRDREPAVRKAIGSAREELLEHAC